MPSSTSQHLARQVFAWLLLAGGTSCTTYVHPASCESGATSCGGVTDARFCAYVAVETEGRDCARLGIVDATSFVVVKAGPCSALTRYQVDHADCRVVEVRAIRDSASADYPDGTPTFTPP